MQIIPPDLIPFSSIRYRSDIQYRELIDNENLGERAERLKLLLQASDIATTTF